MSSSRLCRLHSLGIYPCNLQYKRGSDAKRPIHPLRFFSFLHLVQYVCLLLRFSRSRPGCASGPSLLLRRCVCVCVCVCVRDYAPFSAPGDLHYLCAGVWVRDCDTSWGQWRLARQSATAARFKMAPCVPPPTCKLHLEPDNSHS